MPALASTEETGPEGKLAGEERRKTPLSWPALLLTSCLLVPNIGPAPLGWLFFFVPLAAYAVLLHQGRSAGTLQVRNAVLLALLLVLPLGSWKALLLGLTMVPVGFLLDSARQKQLSPAQTGGLAVLVLALLWLTYWGGYGLALGVNPYTLLCQVLDAALVQGRELYFASDQALTSEQAAIIRETTAGLQTMLPRILPGLLVTSLLVTVWANLVLAARLVTWLRPAEPGWPLFSQWCLPDQLAWLPIGAGVLLVLGPGATKDLGVNLLLLSSVVYLFQGLAVMAHFMGRWQLARPFKILVWLLVLMQSLGMTLLAVLGVADTWADFRRLRCAQPERPTTE